MNLDVKSVDHDNIKTILDGIMSTLPRVRKSEKKPFLEYSMLHCPVSQFLQKYTNRVSNHIYKRSVSSSCLNQFSTHRYLGFLRIQLMLTIFSLNLEYVKFEMSGIWNIFLEMMHLHMHYFAFKRVNFHAAGKKITGAKIQVCQTLIKCFREQQFFS